MVSTYIQATALESWEGAAIHYKNKEHTVHEAHAFKNIKDYHERQTGRY